MPTRVDVIHRRVVDVGVAVQSLHAGWDDAVRLGKASQRGVVPAGVVVHQAEICGVAELTGEPVLRRRDSALVAHFTPGFVAGFGDDCPRGIGHDAGRAENPTTLPRQGFASIDGPAEGGQD